MQMNTSSSGATAIKQEHGQPCPPPGLAAARSARPALLCLVVLWLHVVGLPPAAAQPKIITQPRNASVSLGQDAQFGLSASSTLDLTFQWWFAGRPLEGATNSSVTVTNAALSSLGRYEVVVTDSAGQVASAPAWLLLARWTELVVFGRGHDSPRCGGLVWQNYLANRLGVRLRNYHVEGAPVFNPSIVPSSLILSQIERYLSSSAPTMNTLVGLWQGSVDVMFGMPVEEAVANQLALMRMLVDAGARSFLLPTMWPPELIPFWVANPDSYPNLTSELVTEYNAQVTEGLKALQAEHALTIYRPDMFAFLKAVSQNPAAYGFRKPLGLDFICNELHFTTAVHRLSSEEFYRSLNPPVRIDSAIRTLGGDVALNWRGGSPPFRLERAKDLLSGQWEPVGELGFVPTATLKPASPQEFFRVLPLGQ